MNTYEMIGQWIKVIVALLIVLLLIYTSLRIGKKYTTIVGKKSYIKVIDTVPIYNKSAITIVKIGNKYMVLGVSENNTQLITELSEEDINLIKKDDSLRQEQIVGFKEWLKFKKQGNKKAE